MGQVRRKEGEVGVEVRLEGVWHRECEVHWEKNWSEGKRDTRRSGISMGR